VIPTHVLESLGPDACEAFLANESVGRVAVVVDEQPHILPVNYVAEGATIVFRTGPDTILTEASLRRVAFEVDGIHERHQTGWSVCVHGYGREITDGLDAESRRLKSLFVDCWAPEPRDRWFKIIPHSVTGRHLSTVRDPAVRG
jgi:uncharacterized protein